MDDTGCCCDDEADTGTGECKCCPAYDVPPGGKIAGSCTCDNSTCPGRELSDPEIFDENVVKAKASGKSGSGVSGQFNNQTVEDKMQLDKQQKSNTSSSRTSKANKEEEEEDESINQKSNVALSHTSVRTSDGAQGVSVAQSSKEDVGLISIKNSVAGSQKSFETVTDISPSSDQQLEEAKQNEGVGSSRTSQRTVEKVEDEAVDSQREADELDQKGRVASSLVSRGAVGAGNLTATSHDGRELDEVTRNRSFASSHTMEEMEDATVHSQIEDELKQKGSVASSGMLSQKSAESIPATSPDGGQLDEVMLNRSFTSSHTSQRTMEEVVNATGQREEGELEQNRSFASSPASQKSSELVAATSNTAASYDGRETGVKLRSSLASTRGSQRSDEVLLDVVEPQNQQKEGTEVRLKSSVASSRKSVEHPRVHIKEEVTTEAIDGEGSLMSGRPSVKSVEFRLDNASESQSHESLHKSALKNKNKGKLPQIEERTDEH